MTNEIGGWLGALGGAVQQMQQWPAAILIVAVLCVAGMMLKHLSPFPNKFIPSVILLLGATSNALLGDPGAVNPSQRYPVAVLALQGVLLGFAAWAAHKLVIARFEKYLPFNDPEEPKKPNQ